MDFLAFPKIARLSREVIITEKIDGTNAQIAITPEGEIFSGSRNRWITPNDDNFGFAKWVQNNKEELMKLGPGRHFGEWWGFGIQRGYGLSDKRFSLFNVEIWEDNQDLPSCCSVVPTIYRGVFNEVCVNNSLELLVNNGSLASPCFKNPEGIIIFHSAANVWFKKTIKKDEVSKYELQGK